MTTEPFWRGFRTADEALKNKIVILQQEKATLEFKLLQAEIRINDLEKCHKE